MTIPSSGAISLNQLHIEAGGSSGSQVSMNDTDVRDMVLAASSTQNSFNTYYGAKQAFVMSMVVGFGNIFQDDGYNPASTTRIRGYNDGEFSNRTPSSYGTIGGTNSQTNSNCRDTDYFNDNRVCFYECAVISTTATSTHNTTSVQLGISNAAGLATPNSSTSFQRMSINGTVFPRSSASYSNMTGGTAGQDVSWTWQHTFSPAQSFTNDTVAVPPFTATGTSTKAIVAAV